MKQIKGVMSWEDKTEMVNIYDINNYELFKEFVLSRITLFDLQALDMFLTLINLRPNEIEEHWKFYFEVLQSIRHLDVEAMSASAYLRLGILENYVNDLKK